MRQILAFVVFAIGTSVWAANMPPWVGDVQRAFRDELRRSVDSLSIPSLKRPYYIEYTLRYRWTTRAKASFGGLLDSARAESARLTVGIRVGSPERDNTNFFDAALLFFGGDDREENYRNRLVPYQLDYRVVRRNLWLATDAAFKAAVEQYAKKEAALKNRVQQDTTPDFVLLPPVTLADTTDPIPEVNLQHVAEQIQRVSAIARHYPAIQNATVTFEHLPELVIYANSEGRTFVKLYRQAGIEIIATAQSPDGMPLAQTYAAYSRTLDELPAWDSLERAMHHVAQRLSTQVAAVPMSEAYSGPVLFCRQAAAELFAQVFAPNLVAQRTWLTERGVQEQERYTALQNKIGARVTAEFLSVESTPTLAFIGKTAAAGAYHIDDEGVEPTPLTLVRGGYLENLLSSRVPTRRVRSSNGRMRGGGAMYDVLQVRCNDRRRAVGERELIARMIEILDRRGLQYGYIVSEVLDQNLLYTAVYSQTNGTFPVGSEDQIPALEVERLWRNGKRERVRGVFIAPGGYRVFRDVIAVGKSTYVHNLLAPSVISPYRTGGAQYVIATVASPDILVEDVELRPVEGGYPTPPLIASPLQEQVERKQK
ncbi:MAG: metallopeptidase TldD-related protein [Chlorobi bacterium]|nr:metallopeptidase TldD-related protein [Chlorobiota bacterium]